MTIVSILRSRFPDSSQNFLRRLLRDRRVLLDGKLVVNDQEIRKEQSVTILPKKKYLRDLPVLYEDPHLVVVEKPAGLLSVATNFEKRETLHALLKKEYSSVWPVQRLDRETSGIMVFALSVKSKEDLKLQFKTHSIYREYQALVEGELSGRGLWKDRLHEDASSYLVTIDPKGSALAITHYEVIRSGKRCSRVKFILETGKKNQIRVQSSHRGHPILGDKKYGLDFPDFNDLSKTSRLAKASGLGRLALHAHKLQFLHPISGKRLSFISPTPF